GGVMLHPIGPIGPAANRMNPVPPEPPRIHQDRVVLSPEPSPRHAPRAIMPDDLVQKVPRPENGVELNPHVVRRPPVKVNPKRPMLRQQPAELHQMRLQELKVRLQPARPRIGEAVPSVPRRPPLPCPKPR